MALQSSGIASIASAPTCCCCCDSTCDCSYSAWCWGTDHDALRTFSPAETLGAPTLATAPAEKVLPLQH